METNDIEVVESPSKVNKFGEALAKEVIGSLIVVGVIAGGKFLNKKIKARRDKKNNIIETTATEQ